MNAIEIIELLGYTSKPSNWVNQNNYNVLMGHLWRSAKDFFVHGSYIFHTSIEDEVLSPRPAIHVVEANSIEAAHLVRDDYAHKIHCKLWNIGTAPFLIIILPGQVRVYSGFTYSSQDDRSGLIAIADATIKGISENLQDFYANQIDSGQIWQSQSKFINPKNRVDQHLLKNLSYLGKQLVLKGLNQRTAHSLIGKFIYIRYLTDRNILTNEWLSTKYHDISLDDVLGENASTSKLQMLATILEDRFNGKIFPLELVDEEVPDTIIQYVASVFRGTDPVSGQINLDFQIYDFSYIPVETLSSIYEQFLHAEGKGIIEGAFYTREFVANYLLSEINSIYALKPKMKILDPACGSGIFLVLAYRSLIEQEINNINEGKISPDRLREILEESIYGIEPIKDACYVTEFSLILTLLSYVEPPELQRNEKFKFPDLHNRRIFESDFFDKNSNFWNTLLEENILFDWVIGNPPWIKIESKNTFHNQNFALMWMKDSYNKKNFPVGKNSLSEAFTWLAREVITESGYVGFLLHATSLFNDASEKYRVAFFEKNYIRRITNFSNLINTLFTGSAAAPAITIIYTKSNILDKKEPILHYGPFAANQIFNFNQDSRVSNLWTIILYEDEIQYIDHYEAEKGQSIMWKIALWGSYIDKKAIYSFVEIFEKRLSDIINERKWSIHQGIEIVDRNKYDLSPEDKYIYVEELQHIKSLDVKKMSGKFYLSVPTDFLYDIPEEKHFLRSRGGKIGLTVTKAPHIFWNVNFAAYSNEDFVLPAPQLSISAPVEDADYLRAISLYLNSSIGKYLLFFHCNIWGIERSKFSPNEAKKIPIPLMNNDQINYLSNIHQELEIRKNKQLLNYMYNHEDDFNDDDLKIYIDEEISNLFQIPEYLMNVVQDFAFIKYKFNKGVTKNDSNRNVSIDELSYYAKSLLKELDEFTEKHHAIEIYLHNRYIICSIEITNYSSAIKPIIRDNVEIPKSIQDLWRNINNEFNQWIYVRKSLRIFIDKRIIIIKPSRLIDWTKTQALIDSDDIISEILNYKG